MDKRKDKDGGPGMAKEIFDDRLLTATAVAALLNVKVSTVRAWCLRRKINFCRVNGRAVRIRLSEVQRIIEVGMVPAHESK
jgi:excisionase family DNA binding protein